MNRVALILAILFALLGLGIVVFVVLVVTNPGCHQLYVYWADRFGIYLPDFYCVSWRAGLTFGWDGR